MSPRVLLVLGCAASLVGCAAGDSASGGDSDLGAQAHDMGLAADAGACALVKVTPATSVGATYLTAVATATTTAAPTWTVFTPTGAVTPVKLDSSGLRVGLDATEPGTYIFHVTLAEFCSGEGVANLIAPQAAAHVYRVRMTPPGSSSLPQQDQLVTIYGNTPQGALGLQLTTGTVVGGVLRGPSGPTAGEVQLFPQGGPEVHVAVGTTGQFSIPLQPGAMYRLVLIPTDPSLAPKRLGPLAGLDVPGISFTVGTGAPVSGTIRDASSAPLPGARVALRDGILPSGLGVAVVNGSYAFRAEPGTYQVAAAAMGWPDVLLDGVDVAAGGGTVSIDHALTRAPVTLRVVRADGVTPVAGALVRARSVPIAGAATVSSSSGPHTAVGVARLEGVTAADGTLPVAALPAAIYDVLVEPPGGLAESTTGARITVTGAGAFDLRLATRVPFTGRVFDTVAAGVPNASVRIVSTGGVVLRQVVTDGTGAFSTSLEAGVPCDVSVEPPPSVALAGVRRHLGSSDGSLGGPAPGPTDLTLLRGLQIDGVVRGPAGVPLDGVGIDVLCASCADPTPFAHAESNGGGGYRVSLPDPGLLVLDGGVD